MKKEDVVVGMRVVPHDKTVNGWSALNKSGVWIAAQEMKQPFLYVTRYDFDELDSEDVKNSFTLDLEDTYGGDFFNAEDFEPYME